MSVEQEQPRDSLPIRCRPDRSNWFLVLIIEGMGLFMVLCPWLTPTKAMDRIPVSLMGLVFLLPALLFTVWLLRAQITAEAVGLRWRGLDGWQTADWKDITDYYDKLLPKKGGAAVIEIGGRKLQISKSLWKENPAFCALIVERATQARAKEWGNLGARPDVDWPRTFDYNTRENRSRRAALYVIWGLAVIFIAMVTPGILRTAAALGWGWGWASAGILVLLLSKKILLVSLAQSQVNDTRRRREQRITVSRDGLTYEAAEVSVRAAWDEVTDYYIAPHKGLSLVCPAVVITQRGRFDFSDSLGDVALLRQIISHNASASAVKTWRSDEAEVLGGNSSCWTSGCQGMGARIYHYRTRANRAFLWFPAALAVASPLTMALNRAVGNGGNFDLTGVAFITGIIGIPTLLAIWRYFADSIETDGVGITQNILGVRRFLCWDQVERFSTSGGDLLKFGNVVGAGTRIRFWIGIADVAELKDEIGRRATHSRNRAWDDAERERTGGTPARR